MLKQPIGVYINWSAYDELSDDVPLTEALAMRQLGEVERLRGLGCRLDYYVMDAFWYAPDGGYRAWRVRDWPAGPGRWLARCAQAGVRPGLWIGANACGKWMGLEVHPAWKESFDPVTGHLCLFRGGFLAHLMETLAGWYGQGVRMFKLDFTHLAAATPEARRTMLPGDIRAASTAALRTALLELRRACPELVLLAYNGLEETPVQQRTDVPLSKAIDTRWLDCFDSVYCGDPRPADVPAANFWRAKDVYSDHMVRVYEFNGYPLPRIDNAGFMIGTTGTCYGRGKTAWRGMLLLSLARGGWVNTYYGNLELLSDDDARWFARAAGMYRPLQSGPTWSFGGMPGAGEAYGWASVGEDGSGLLTVVNPGQGVATVELPMAGGRVLFHDAGFVPTLEGSAIRLGAEQMAVVGVGAMADGRYDLGVGEGIEIPAAIEAVEAAFVADGDKAIRATVSAAAGERLRIVMRQTDAGGRAKRTTGGAPPKGATLGTLLRIEVEQGGRPLAVAIAYDKAIWSGLSWAVGEVEVGAGDVVVRCVSGEKEDVKLVGAVYRVR